MHKFASNVIEKCFEQGSDEDREKIITELFVKTGASFPPPPPISNTTFFIGTNRKLVQFLSQSPILMLLQNQYGNYVIQKIVALSRYPMRERIIRMVLPYTPALKQSNAPNGKYIINCLLKTPVADVDLHHELKVLANATGGALVDVVSPSNPAYDVYLGKEIPQTSTALNGPPSLPSSSTNKATVSGRQKTKAKSSHFPKEQKNQRSQPSARYDHPANHRVEPHRKKITYFGPSLEQQQFSPYYLKKGALPQDFVRFTENSKQTLTPSSFVSSNPVASSVPPLSTSSLNSNISIFPSMSPSLSSNSVHSGSCVRASSVSSPLFPSMSPPILPFTNSPQYLSGQFGSVYLPPSPSFYPHVPYGGNIRNLGIPPLMPTPPTKDPTPLPSPLSSPHYMVNRERRSSGAVQNEGNSFIFLDSVFNSYSTFNNFN
jgi:hypothetical protein